MSIESEAEHDIMAVNSATYGKIAGDHPSGVTDESLIAQAQGGDYAAFEALFLRHRAMVYRYAYQLVGRRDDAEDLVQESFVRAYVNLNRYRDQAKFTTWLLRIVTNLAADRARMHTRRTNLELQESKRGLAWMTLGNQTSPEADLEKSVQVELLRLALSQLSPKHRTAIVLRDVEEKEYWEIAEVLNCSLGGAKLRVLRARRALQTVVSRFSKEIQEGLHAN